ncbi:hypothetical protein NB037_10055 [Rathayibacter sp. ZW T2_19]|uniref:histidine kinase n=1 Tax=Rathayibacter rubneri TaxID=2950106 RepID=A0A9X2DXN2_9MICO|nr:hypothetical protein [Rathayibacter rubneri]MCM6762757.1 hypothetical protein [Rathayibacter rubneri]
MTLVDDTRRTPADVRQENRILVGVVALLGTVLSILAALQAVFALGMLSQTTRGVEGGPVLDVVVRVLVNVTAVAVAVLVLSVVKPERFERRPRVLAALAVAVGVALVRCTLQVIAGVYPLAALDALVVELVVGAMVFGLVTGFGLLFVRTARRVREKEREHARVLLQAVQAVQALQKEELRVRREVAQNLHGRLQNTLVVLTAELQVVAEGSADRERLLAIAARLDELREREVRAASGALYPVDIEHGLVPAIRDLFSRLPVEIAVDLEIDDRYLEVEERGVPLDQRVLLVRTVEEALTNALKHGGANAVRLRLDVDCAAPRPAVIVRLDDDGRGLGGESAWSGLDRLSRQFAVYGGTLELSPSSAGGARLAARLPLQRA